MMQDLHLDLLQETVRNNGEEKYEDIIWESKDFGLFYHLSKARRNLIDWIPFRRGAKILEVGAECGALTGFFLSRDFEVTAVEAEQLKAEILKERFKDCENLKVINGSLKDLPAEETYDCIIAAGSLPLAEQYAPYESDPYERFLKILKTKQNEDGRLVLALPNRLGMKYFSGAREDYTGAPFTNIEGYYYHRDVRTFGRKELAELLDRAGFEGASWYYPYPDWRFPTTIFSDDRLPGLGELNRNLESCDQERYVFFDETKAYDSIIQEGLFRDFANSFLVVYGVEKTSLPVYIKYASERSPKYALRTEQRWNGIVRKVALYPEGVPHIRGIFDSFERLSEYLKDTLIEVAPCRLMDNMIEQKLIPGKSLQQIMQRYALEGKTEEVNMLVTEYLLRLESFEKLHDIDLIFSNLIVPPEAKTAMDIKHATWTLIDYEWTFEVARSKRYVLYRSFLMASSEIQGCDALSLDMLLKRLDLKKDSVATFEQLESEFQKEVLGDTHPTRDMVRQIEPGIVPLETLDKAYRASLEKPVEKKKGFFRR